VPSMRNRLARLDGLRELHRVRILVCKMRYLETKRKRDEAARSLNEREATICQCKAERSSLFQYLHRQEVMETPLRVERVHDRRFWLEYDLEKEEYYLEMDRQDLNEAESQLSQARQEWLRAQKHQDLVKQQWIALQRDVSRDIEGRETGD